MSSGFAQSVGAKRLTGYADVRNMRLPFKEIRERLRTLGSAKVVRMCCHLGHQVCQHSYTSEKYQNEALQAAYAAYRRSPKLIVEPWHKATDPTVVHEHVLLQTLLIALLETNDGGFDFSNVSIGPNDHEDLALILLGLNDYVGLQWSGAKESSAKSVSGQRRKRKRLLSSLIFASQFSREGLDYSELGRAWLTLDALRADSSWPQEAISRAIGVEFELLVQAIFLLFVLYDNFGPKELPALSKQYLTEQYRPPYDVAMQRCVELLSTDPISIRTLCFEQFSRMQHRWERDPTAVRGVGYFRRYPLLDNGDGLLVLASRHGLVRLANEGAQPFIRDRLGASDSGRLGSAWGKANERVLLAGFKPPKRHSISFYHEPKFTGLSEKSALDLAMRGGKRVVLLELKSKQPDLTRLEEDLDAAGYGWLKAVVFGGKEKSKSPVAQLRIAIESIRLGHAYLAGTWVDKDVEIVPLIALTCELPPAVANSFIDRYLRTQKWPRGDKRTTTPKVVSIRDVQFLEQSNDEGVNIVDSVFEWASSPLPTLAQFLFEQKGAGGKIPKRYQDAVKDVTDFFSLNAESILKE